MSELAKFNIEAQTSNTSTDGWDELINEPFNSPANSGEVEKSGGITLYDADLNIVESTERKERIADTLQKEIDFISTNFGVDRDFLQKRVDNLAAVEWKVRTPHKVQYMGEVKTVNGGRNAAAFFAKKSQTYKDGHWDFENAVYFDDRVSPHTLDHKLLHALSANTEINFGESDIGWDKGGLNVSGYNRQDEKVDDTMFAEGLNEGVTELLAAKFDGATPDVYLPQVYVADLLISPNNPKLVQAYFAEDKEVFRGFLDDFDARQKSIQSSRLTGLSKSAIIDIDDDLLRGCVEYTISHCETVEQLTAERQRLLPIFNKIISHNEFGDNYGDEQKQATIDMLNQTLLLRRNELLKDSQGQ